MTRKDLVEAVALKCSMPTAQAAKAVDATIGIIKHELIVMHGVVALPGFGTFGVRDRAARKGTNPRTGEPIDISASKLPYFTASKSFKAAVKS